MEYNPTIPSMIFLGVAWVLWIVVMGCLALARAMRTKPAESFAGISGVLPFKSREEFLKARMEMDLDEFLDRCEITPKTITRASQEVAKPCETVQIVQRTIDKFGSAVPPAPGSIGQIGLGGSGSAGGPGCGSTGLVGTAAVAIGSVGSGGSVGNAYQAAAAFGPAGGIPKIDPPLKVGCWYRVKESGALVLCKSFCKNYGYFFQRSDSVMAYRLDEVEIATPRVGETWTSKECPIHFPSPTYTYKATSGASAQPECAHLYHNYALCGCSVPYEFGHGKI